MDRLSLLFDFAQQWLITPLWHCLTGLLDFNGRLGAPFLLVSGTVAYLLYRHRRRQGNPGARSFAGFLGGRAVWLHPSAQLDYQYYLVRALLHVALILPILALIHPWLLQAEDVQSALTRLWGERPRLAQASWLMMLYGLGVFLVSDFVHYWLHRAFHSRWLWEFHKVHHSATVMVPPTAPAAFIWWKSFVKCWPRGVRLPSIPVPSTGYVVAPCPPTPCLASATWC